MAALNKAQTAPALNQGLTEEASLNQGGPKAQLAASATPTVAAAPGESKNEKTISHPSWLLAIAGLLAGLYYFLKEGKKKGKA